jgi:hypothetical protein
MRNDLVIGAGRVLKRSVSGRVVRAMKVPLWGPFGSIIGVLRSFVHDLSF